MSTQTQIEKMYTISQFCEMLQVSANTARNWIKEGKLKAYQPGRQHLIPASAIIELLEGRAGE